MSAKMVTLIAFSFIAAGLSGFGIAEIIPNNTSPEENLNDFSVESRVTEFSEGAKLNLSSRTTPINP